MLEYLPLVLAALTRRKLRTVLTLLSVTVAFILFGLLMGTDASFQRMADATNPKVLEIFPRFANRLTDAMGLQIAAMPNVAAVSAGASVFGYYRDPKTFAYAVMVDNEAGWPNAPISPAQWAEWRAKPDGVFLSRIAATAWDLKKGDIFTIIAPSIPRADGGKAWRFQILDVLDDTPYRPAGFSYGSYQYYKLSRPAADQPKVGLF
jgi:putative ABC transport system permease protein